MLPAPLPAHPDNQGLDFAVDIFIVRNMSNYGNEELDRLASMLKALSNPNRLRIFTKMTERCGPGAACCADDRAVKRYVGDLGRDLELAPSTVSHHIKELRHAGLIRVERKGKSVVCWVDDQALRALKLFFEQSMIPQASDVESDGCAVRGK
jgi:ArsR family transcriptional regulator